MNINLLKKLYFLKRTDVFMFYDLRFYFFKSPTCKPLKGPPEPSGRNYLDFQEIVNASPE